MQLKLVSNENKYWDFIKKLRFHPDNISGFFSHETVSDSDHRNYMKEYGESYKICLNGNDPVGFIGCVDNDIRLAVDPKMKNRGIGKFMLNQTNYPYAKVLHKNTASLNLFLSSGFVCFRSDETFIYLRRENLEYFKIKHNPFKIVEMFEETMADYTGAPYAVSVTSCTDALFLCCKYYEVKEVTIPAKTYLSVPQSIMHAGGKVKFTDDEWSGLYQLKPYPIYDSAKRLTSNMYIKNTSMCLSFHIKKHLRIGKGGMILTDDYDFSEWLKVSRYEGRHAVPYKDDNITSTGWNMYMTPQQAAHGLCLMQNYPLHVPDLVENGGYLDLRKFDLFGDKNI